ncbi:MAG: hypothetical protein JXA89_15495 [Anaerolineae bacterium]|nr:hypothetical protein [Anaerolineae bacterium]
MTETRWKRGQDENDCLFRRFSTHYKRVAQEKGCAFLDTSEVIVSGNLDGIHFEAVEHQKLGRAVAALVKEIL